MNLQILRPEKNEQQNIIMANVYDHAFHIKDYGVDFLLIALVYVASSDYYYINGKSCYFVENC